MGREYTRKLLSEAWKSALAFFLKGECPVTISKAALGAIILLLFTYFLFRPQFIEVLVGLILTPIMVFLLAFLFFFVRAPYKLHKEQEDKICVLESEKKDKGESDERDSTRNREKLDILCQMHCCLDKWMSMLWGGRTYDDTQVRQRIPSLTAETVNLIKQVVPEKAETFEGIKDRAAWDESKKKIINLKEIILQYARNIHEEKTDS